MIYIFAHDTVTGPETLNSSFVWDQTVHPLTTGREQVEFRNVDSILNIKRVNKVLRKPRLMEWIGMRCKGKVHPRTATNAQGGVEV
jgi:hypothetical protein